MKIFLTLFTLISINLASQAGTESTENNALVRVNSTRQSWSPTQPWDKSAPSSRSALGVLLPNKHILTTAEMAANSTYIELENAAATRTISAKVTAIDYETNLALLAPDPDKADQFFAEMQPLELSGAAKIGDKVEVLQLENNGMQLITSATIQGADVISSFTSGHYFLTYEAKGSLQSASSSFSLPIIKNGKLLGLLSSYDSEDQIIDIIAPEIITQFLADAVDGEYTGFPSLGVGITNTVDPSFRLWLKLPEDVGGLYVTRVLKGSAADKAGILEGDVLLSAAGKAIGRRGYYDNENYGRLFWSHLVRGSYKVSESLDLTILREGEKKEITATLTRPNEKLIPAHQLDRAPNYLVKGGLIFQELSRTYLKAFGKEWQSSAPLNLLDALNSPEDFEEGRNKLVFLSASIPTPATTGYERINNFIIAKVNGQDIADIQSLIKAFEKPDADGLHTIEFVDGKPKTIYLDAATSDTIDAELLKRGIPALSRP